MDKKPYTRIHQVVGVYFKNKYIYIYVYTQVYTINQMVLTIPTAGGSACVCPINGIREGFDRFW